MESITLNVKPDVLTAKAGELDAEKNTIRALMDQATSEVTSLTGTWISEASDEYQNRYKQIADDVQNVLDIIAEHVGDLNEAASLYTAAEQRAKSAAEGLPTDGVFKV